MATAIAKAPVTRGLSAKRTSQPSPRTWLSEENNERAESAKSLLEYRAFLRGNKGEIDLQKEYEELQREIAHLYDLKGWELAESMKKASSSYLLGTDIQGKQFFKAGVALQREYFEYLEANDLLDR
jgi:hypothetical protein